MIQEHLEKIAHDFKQGDFSDPEKIYGNTMPGLTALKNAKIGQIAIDYKSLADGAQITYSTQVSALVSAIHQWFAAQLSDHARHAVAGNTKHTMHHN